MRFANPMALFPRILDIFMAQPFGNRSLLQHMFGMAIQEGVNNIQKSITILITQRIHEPDLPQVIQKYVEADDIAKAEVKSLAFYEDIDIVYAIIKKSQDAEWCTDISLSHDQMALADEAYASWRQAVEHIGSERTAEAELYAHMKQLMKLYIRLRDKVKMLEMINEVRKTPYHPTGAGAVRFVIVVLALCNYLDLAEELLLAWYHQASGEAADIASDALHRSSK
jgi:hypothetical protein